MAGAVKKGGSPGPRVIVEIKIDKEVSDKKKTLRFVRMKESVTKVLGLKPEKTPPKFEMKPTGSDGKSKATWKAHERYIKVGTGGAKYTIFFTEKLNFTSGSTTKSLKSITIGLPIWANTEAVIEWLLGLSKVKGKIQAIKTPNGHRILIAPSKT